MKKFLILTVSVLFVSCPVGPSIPTEALFCIAGKTKGTARIEAVGGNTATELFSVTADGEAVRLDSNELAFSSESSFYKVRYIDNGSRKGIEYPTGFRIVLPDDGNGVEIAVLTGREVRDFPEKQRVEILEGLNEISRRNEVKNGNKVYSAGESEGQTATSYVPD